MIKNWKLLTVSILVGSVVVAPGFAQSISGVLSSANQQLACEKIYTLKNDKITFGSSCNAAKTGLSLMFRNDGSMAEDHSSGKQLYCKKIISFNIFSFKLAIGFNCSDVQSESKVDNPDLDTSYNDADDNYEEEDESADWYDDMDEDEDEDSYYDDDVQNVDRRDTSRSLPPYSRIIIPGDRSRDNYR